MDLLSSGSLSAHCLTLSVQKSIDADNDGTRPTFSKTNLIKRKKGHISTESQYSFAHYLSPRHRSNLQLRTRLLHLSAQSSYLDIDREGLDQVLPGRSRTSSGYRFCLIFRGGRCTCPTIAWIFPLPLQRGVQSLGLVLADLKSDSCIGGLRWGYNLRRLVA